MPAKTETHIAHHVPGRLRLTVPGLKKDPELAERLGRELAEIEGVAAVTVRPAARSVLVRYEPNGRDGIVASLAPIVRIQAAPPARRQTPPPEGAIGDIAAEWMHERWDRIDGGLRRATDGALNIATVIPLFLLFVAMRQILTKPDLAAIPWYTALYWAERSFSHYYRHRAAPSGLNRATDAETGEVGPE